MSDAIVVRRRPGRGHRKGPRLHPGRSVAPNTLAAAGPAGEAPRLTMREPESSRRALASGSLAFLLHASVVLALLVVTWLNPEIVEDVIPVQLLPGSVEPPAPAPAPQAIQPQPLVNAAAAAPVVAPSAQPLAPRSAPDVRMDRVDPMSAPTQIQQRDVRTERLAAVRSTEAPTVAPTDVERLAPSRVRPSTIALPNAPVTGPRRVTSHATESARVAEGASRAFARAGQSEDYDARVRRGVPVPATGGGAEAGDVQIDTQVAAAYVGGEGAGGTGTAVGVTSCFQSAYVQSYIEQVRERTMSRWVLEDEYPPGTSVQLRFTLDAAGTAREIEFVRAQDDSLGRSAVEALKAASPFPPMDDNVRCMAGRPLVGKFTIPRS